MDRADTPPLGLGRWRRSKRAQAADSGLHSVHEDDRAEVHALVEGARSGDEAAFAAL